MPQAGLSVRRGVTRRDETPRSEGRHREAQAARARMRSLDPQWSDSSELGRSAQAQAGATVSTSAPERAAAPVGAHAGTGVPGRRTVTIQGRGAERYRGVPDRRRPARRPHERAGFKPDRTAMWAVFLGVLMILAAATSSHAAILSQHTMATPRKAVLPAQSRTAQPPLRAGAHVSLRVAR
jgi:hypothetical protein